MGRRPDFERLLAFFENPELSAHARVRIYSEMNGDLMILQGYPQTTGIENDFIRSQFRIAARSPKGDSFGSNVLDNYLPNWLGLKGGLTPRTAAQVFAKRPRSAG
jgi:hypothetical protein